MTSAGLFSDLFGAGSIRRVGRDVQPHFSDHETEMTATLVRADGSEVYVFHPEYRLFFFPELGIIKGVRRLELSSGRPSAAVRRGTEIAPGSRHVLSVLMDLSVDPMQLERGAGVTSLVGGSESPGTEWCLAP